MQSVILHLRSIIVVSLLVLISSAGAQDYRSAAEAEGRGDFTQDLTEDFSAGGPQGWYLVNDSASWSRRAGLQVVQLRNRLYLMGGRTARQPSIPPIPGDSDIWGDVWMSKNYGRSWEKIQDADSAGYWPARAYFRAVTMGNYMYVLGGQDFDVVPNPNCPPPFINCSPFIDNSNFFNDVWRSKNGVHWQQATDSAGWEGRAGLSSVVFEDEIYVMGGSKANDASIVGGSQRIYFNDVWKSPDGRYWTALTDSADWAPRAGAIVTVKDGYMYLLGGEAGFICDPLPFCDPPYFNDVWRSADGVNWEVVTVSAPWVKRPGHHCVVYRDKFVLFGGFGLLVNPMDVWVSDDGADWLQISTSPWNAVSPDEIKYDFDALVVKNNNPRKAAILTFGGDRETFDFSDPTNYLRLDNDVWRYVPSPAIFTAAASGNEALVNEKPLSRNGDSQKVFKLQQNSPNPFNPGTVISYTLPNAGYVTLKVYNVLGQQTRELVSEYQEAGAKTYYWDGMDDANREVAAGVYFARIRFGAETQIIRMSLQK